MTQPSTARLCAHCDGPIPEDARVDSRYCRPACRVAAHRVRHAPAPDELPPKASLDYRHALARRTARERLFRLPSPALVISMVALALVLGGTAVAATTGTHADAKADTKLVKKLAPTLSVKDAKTVGGHKVKSFFVTQFPGTAATVIASVDGVTLKAECDNVSEDPYLSVENDSGTGGMLAGYITTYGDILNTHFTSTPVDLSNGSNGAGFVNVQLSTDVAVSIQFATTGTIGGEGGDCYFSGSIIAS